MIKVTDGKMGPAEVECNLESTLERLQKIQREASSPLFEITTSRDKRSPYRLLSIKVILENADWGRQEWTFRHKAHTADEQESDIRFIETVANSERFMEESLRLAGENK